jgi:hypothetical protein
VTFIFHLCDIKKTRNIHFYFGWKSNTNIISIKIPGMTPDQQQAYYQQQQQQWLIYQQQYNTWFAQYGEQVSYI